MSSTERNSVEENYVKPRQMISNNSRNMLNGIEIKVNEDKLQDKGEKIRKPFTTNVKSPCTESSRSIYLSVIYPKVYELKIYVETTYMRGIHP
jgi:hypothetical protein